MKNIKQSFDMYSDDGFQITVTVCNPDLRLLPIKHTVYTIRGEDINGPFECVRRYSDFDLVRAIMLMRWPGCLVPSLPEKKAVGNFESIFIEERRIGLQKFLLNLTQLKHLWYSQENQSLVKGPTEIDDILSHLSKINLNEIIHRYESIFTNINGLQINGTIVGKINNFSIFLRKIPETLKIFMQISANISQARKIFNSQLTSLFNYMLPQYEKRCLSEYVSFNAPQEAFMFSNTKDIILQQCKKKFKQIQCRFFNEDLYNFLKEQNNLIQAFNDAMRIKQNLENEKLKLQQKKFQLQLQKQDLLVGKVSFTNFLKPQSNQQTIKQIEKQMQKYQKQLGQYELVCDISTVLLGYFEIDKFKKSREKSYYDLLKKIITLQLDYANIEFEIWNIVNEKQIYELSDYFD